MERISGEPGSLERSLAEPSPAERKMDLLDVLLVFARCKWLIFIWVVVGLAIAIVALLCQPTLYKSVATLMPPQQEQSSSALLGQLGALSALTGGGGAGNALGLKNPADLYVSILKTNIVADHIVDKFHLMQGVQHPRPGCCRRHAGQALEVFLLVKTA